MKTSEEFFSSQFDRNMFLTPEVIDHFYSVVGNVHFDTQDKLQVERNKLAKMVEGSNNYLKRLLKIKKLETKLANQRKDMLYQSFYRYIENQKKKLNGGS